MTFSRALRMLLSLSLVALSSPLFAQQTGTIVGTVSATDGSVLPGVTVEARYPDGLRGASLPRQQMDLALVVRTERERLTEEATVALDSPPAWPHAYAGVGLRGIPAATCERMFGSPRQAVVVSSVEVGSPAWVAGIRAGDVIDTVDGAPVPDVNELQRRIVDGGEAGRAMAFGVRRGTAQRHDSEVQLADYREDSGAWIPLIFWLDNGTYEDRLSIGPFGLVMSNRNHYIADSTTRRVKTRNVFSALLGLFRIETTPEETEVRLLWLIRFDT